MESYSRDFNDGSQIMPLGGTLLTGIGLDVLKDPLFRHLVSIFPLMMENIDIIKALTWFVVGDGYFNTAGAGGKGRERRSRGMYYKYIRCPSRCSIHTST